jgi:phage tail sheath protein FI
VIRRLTLFIVNSIERGTRWMAFERSGPALWSRVSSQVTAFLEALQQEGAFTGHSASENYFVICDERVNDAGQVAAGRCQLLFGFAISRPGDFQACLVTHERAGSSVRAVSVNRYALPPQS